MLLMCRPSGGARTFPDLRSGDGRRHLRRPDDRGLRGLRARREGGGAPVSAVNATGLVVAVGLVIFMIAALLFPERF
ncbi:potassium-transporting ATPase subunit F [Streptosporangium minutum]|uniref:Potassium-transporting ATPase subunit F n=1 Tax=Streptosporangium minutum TaxID=569862 RepID=A0A243RWP8_9ACTN|nr:potassium-transporting ATPase subunit F [Streptosporangium minutum]